MSLFSRLLGGGATKPDVEAELHKGFAITPVPIREGSHYRVSARIEKVIGGETRTHTLIRADTLENAESAAAASVAKAKVLIDERGDRLFE